MDRRKEEWWRWGFVPVPLLDEIYRKYSNEDQRLQECANFYVNCNDYASWRDLCVGLFYINEMTAARKAKTLIPQTGERCCVVYVQVCYGSHYHRVSFI